MNRSTWRASWENGWVTDPGGNPRSPVWGDEPEYAAAHALVDRWGGEHGLERRLPRIGPWPFWWPLRFILHRSLARMLPQLRLLLRIRQEPAGRPDRILLHSPPEPWWRPLLSLVFPEAVIEDLSPRPRRFGTRVAYARAFLRRAAASSRRLRRLPPPRRDRPRVLVVSQDRMWNGSREAQLGSVIEALERGGMEPVVISRPWGDPEHRSMSLRSRPPDHLFVDHVLARHVLRRGYPRLPRLELPSRGFEAQGVELAPLVRGVLRRGTRQLYRQRQAYFLTLPDLVRAIGGEAAVITDENGGSHGIKAGFRRSRIPVVAVQHGVIHADHLSYIFPPGTDPEAVPLCDVTCVYGEWDRDLLTERSIYPAETVSVTGHVQMDGVGEREWGSRGAEGNSLRERVLPPGSRHLLLFTSQGEFRADAAPRLLSALARSRTGNVLVIRPHPQEGPAEFWLEAARSHEVADRVLVEGGGDLQDWLDACDVHLSVSSTVLGEAALWGRPNIVVGSKAGGDFCGCLEAGVATELDRFPSLDAALDHWLNPTPESRAEHETRRARYVERHFHRLDGKAGERVAAAVEHAVRKRR